MQQSWGPVLKVCGEGGGGELRGVRCRTMERCPSDCEVARCERWGEAALGSVCSAGMSKRSPPPPPPGWGWGQPGLEGRVSPSHGAAVGSGQRTGLEVLLRMPGWLQPGCSLLLDPELADTFVCVFNSKLQRNVSYCP